MKETIKRQRLFFISLIGIVAVSLILGTTFAYQTMQIEKTESSSTDMTINVAKLNVSYEKTNTINIENIPLLPDYKTADYLEFTIKTNDTTHDVAYQITLNNLEYSKPLKSENFKYTITIINNEKEFVIGGGDFSSLTGTSFNLAFVMNSYRIIEKGSSEKLRVYLWLKETNDIQNIENSSFKGNIEISSLFSDEINETIYKTFKVYGNSLSELKLPSEYQQVEYIESSGTQYINTGYVNSSNYQPYKIDVDFKLESLLTTSFVFGTARNTGNQYSLVYGYSLTDKAWLFGRFGSSGSSIRFGTPDTNRHNIKYVFGKGLYFDGVLENSTVTQASTSTSSGKNIGLFARIRGTTPNSYANMRMYNCKFYEAEDVLVRYFIPCYRKSDNVVGLYDLVNHVFYTNNGTGTFDKGKDLSSEFGSVGDYDDITGKYKISVKVNDEEVALTNIYLNEPLRKVGEYADYIDFIKQIVVRNVKVVKDSDTSENSYIQLETPIIEPLGGYSIPYIEDSNISFCSTNNVCSSNIEIETNN